MRPCQSVSAVCQNKRGGVPVKRVFAILAAVAAGLGMTAAIIAAVASRREDY